MTRPPQRRLWCGMRALLLAPLLLVSLPVAANAQCADGRVATEGGCCWPAPTWSDTAARCQGPPQCRAGWSAAGDSCIERAAAVQTAPPEAALPWWIPQQGDPPQHDSPDGDREPAEDRREATPRVDPFRLASPTLAPPAQTESASSESLDLTHPDPRLDRVLLRARALAERGLTMEALGVVDEASGESICPPYMWDADTASAVRRGVYEMRHPDDHVDTRMAGVVTMIVAGGSAVVTLLVLGLSALGAAVSAAFGGAGDVDLAPFAVAWGIEGAVLLGGLGTFLAGLPNSDVANFNERRNELTRRMPRDMQPTVAFEPTSPCAVSDVHSTGGAW